MKIKAEVIAVETSGDALDVSLQGKAEADAEWRPMLRFNVQVPESIKNRRAFYVGRDVRISIEPV
ncbi:MAG: hypothetical protein ABL964_09885 [Steroidobacteraceae bacterium]